MRGALCLCCRSPSRYGARRRTRSPRLSALTSQSRKRLPPKPTRPPARHAPAPLPALRPAAPGIPCRERLCDSALSMARDKATPHQCHGFAIDSHRLLPEWGAQRRCPAYILECQRLNMANGRGRRDPQHWRLRSLLVGGLFPDARVQRRRFGLYSHPANLKQALARRPASGTHAEPPNVTPA